MNSVPACRPLTTSKYLSNLTRSRRARVSPNSLDHGLQVHLQTHLIMASKFISRPARLRAASLHNHGLQVHLYTCLIPASKCISEFTRSQSPSASPIPLDPGLQVHLWVHSISVSKCISNLAQSRPPSASLSSLELRLQAHLNTLDEVHLQGTSAVVRRYSGDGDGQGDGEYIFGRPQPVQI